MKILAPARIARAAGIVLLACAITLFLIGVALLDQLELKTYDMRLRSLEQTPPRHVTIATIDEQSLARIGRWPWSRAVHAELAKRLDEAGARVIAFDLFFPERESSKIDAQFAREIAATRKTVLGTLFLLSPADARYYAGTSLDVVAPQAITDVTKSAEFLPDVPIRDAYGVIVSIPELQAAASYTGHLNVLPDADGVVRRVPLIVRHAERYFAAFDVQVARAFAPDKPLSLQLTEYGIAGITVAGRHVALSESGDLLVRYRGPEATTFDTVPIADILERKADPALLRDRVVLIGNTAKGIGDTRVTPYGATFPGVEVRANIIENLIEGDILERPDWMKLIDSLAMLVLGAAMIWLLPRWGVAGGAVLAAALLGGWIWAAFYLFRSAGLWLNMVYPTLLIVLLFASTTLVHYFFRVSEQRYLKRAFQHYVPPAVVDSLVADAGRLRLGGEKRELTVLFSDIRGFTTLSEAMEPEELVKLMNEYFTLMTQQVFAHRGSLDKYIGDAIMAVYGAPIAEPQHPLLACRSALDMVRALRALQQSLRSRGLPAIDIGIGINTGPMIVGNMGSADRFNYTVVGDAVNLASRIEHLNKEYGTNVLVSEHTFEHVKGEFPVSREVDRVQVRGRTQPVRLFELIPPDKYSSLDWLEEYRAAYTLMREGELARAKVLFAALHARTGDAVSAFHSKAT